MLRPGAQAQSESRLCLGLQRGDLLLSGKDRRGPDPAFAVSATVPLRSLSLLFQYGLLHRLRAIRPVREGGADRSLRCTGESELLRRLSTADRQPRPSRPSGRGPKLLEKAPGE